MNLTTETTYAPVATRAPQSAIPDRYVGERECKEITALARATRHRLWRAGRFPAPYEISPGRHAWLLSELMTWVQSRKKVA